MAEVPYKASPNVEPAENIPFRPFEPRVGAETFGGLIAKGIGEFGQETSQVGERWGKVQVDAQINKTLKEGDDAVNNLRTLQGQDAIDYSNNLQDHLEEIVTRNGQGLTAAQQNAYLNAVRPYQYRLWNGEIVTTQKRAQLQVSKSVSDDTISHGIDLGARFADNPDGPDAQNALNKVKSGYRQQVIDAGNANVPGALDAADRQAEAAVRTAQADRIAVTDKAKAIQFVQDHEQELGTGATVLEARYRAGAEKDQAEFGADALAKVYAAPPEQRAAIARQYERFLPPEVFRALTTPQAVPAAPPAQAPGANPAATIEIESANKPQYGTGKYQGLGQFDRDEMMHYHITNPNDRAQVARAIRQEAEEFRPRLTQGFGREPTAADYYLAHQQGVAGIINHVTHPEKPAWENMHDTAEGRAKGVGWAQRAVWGNMTKEMKAQFPGGVNTVSSADFVRLWNDRFNRAAIRTAGSEE